MNFRLTLLLLPLPMVLSGALTNRTASGHYSEILSHPGVRYGHVMAYHEGRGSIFIFGGFRQNGTPLNDLWEWDGQRWVLVSSSGPAPRRWSGMVYDRSGDHLVLFGGRDGIGRNGKSLSDTWIWTGEWRLIMTDGPPGRDHHGMVYDPARDRVVVFGGWDGASNRNDTWEWDGNRWFWMSDSGPSPRAAVGMTFDESNHVTLLFGGKDLKDTFGDTWVWNGKEWMIIETSGPPARSFHALAYDNPRKKGVLFGGRHDTALHGDTWEWDGTSWREISTYGPPKGGVYAMSFDQNRTATVLFGGGFMQGGSWVLHDQQWLYRNGDWESVGE